MGYRPAYHITLGQYVLDSTDANRVLELDLQSGMHTPVNECRIVLPQFHDLKLEPGMDISVKLGFERALHQVFSGKINRIEEQPETITLIVRSAFSRLVKSRSDRYFEGVSAGEIATSICKQESIVSGVLNVGLRFSYYALGGEFSAYEHLKRLAGQCGFDFYADEKDRMVFSNTVEPGLFPFSYGANMMQFHLINNRNSNAKWEVYGESPASFGQGPQGATWLTKKNVQGNAGQGGELIQRVFDPTIRTVDNAGLMARALQEKNKTRKLAILNVPGAPEIKIGDSVQINQMPENQQNGMYKVTGLRHRLTARLGFVSQFNLQER